MSDWYYYPPTIPAVPFTGDMLIMQTLNEIVAIERQAVQSDDASST